jgi:hypothetical protein
MMIRTQRDRGLVPQPSSSYGYMSDLWLHKSTIRSAANYAPDLSQAIKAFLVRRCVDNRRLRLALRYCCHIESLAQYCA